MKINKIKETLTIQNLPVNRSAYELDEYEDLTRVEGIFKIDYSELPVRVNVQLISSIELVTYKGRLVAQATLENGFTVFVRL